MTAWYRALATRPLPPDPPTTAEQIAADNAVESSTYARVDTLTTFVQDHGAVGDSAHLTDGVVTVAGGHVVVTSASAPFLASCVGKTAVLPGLVTTILSRQSASQVTLAATTTTTGTGVILDWGTDNTAAFQATITAAQSTGGARTIALGGGNYLCGPLTMTVRGLHIAGTSKDRGGQIFTFGGDWLTLGTDNGLAWDGSYFDGPGEGLVIENLSITAVGCDTDLDNATWILAGGYDTSPKYAAGSRGIVDWRSGSIRLSNVRFRGYEFWIWAIQSDVNFFERVETTYCHDGYLGPKCDQQTFTAHYALFCDRALDLDSTWCVRVQGWFVGCGTATKAQVRVRSQYARGSRETNLDNCWWETYAGQGNVLAAVDVGVGDTYAGRGVTIRNPTVMTSGAGTGHHFLYLASIGNSNGGVIEVDYYGCEYIGKLVSFNVTTQSPLWEAKLEAGWPATSTGNTVAGWDNVGTPTGIPRILFEETGVLGTSSEAMQVVGRRYRVGAPGSMAAVQISGGAPTQKYASIQFLNPENFTTYAAITAGVGGSTAAQKLTINAAAGVSINSLPIDSHTNDGVVPPMVSQRWYCSAGVDCAAATSTLGRMQATPFWVPAQTTFDTLAIEISTLSGTGVVHVGIYADNGLGQPGALVVDAGTVDVTSAGVKTVAISQVLQRGWYYLAALNTTATVGWQGFIDNMPGVPSSNTTTAEAAGTTLSRRNSWGMNSVTGPGLPGTFVAVGSFSNGPRIQIRVA